MHGVVAIRRKWLYHYKAYEHIKKLELSFVGNVFSWFNYFTCLWRTLCSSGMLSKQIWFILTWIRSQLYLFYWILLCRPRFPWIHELFALVFWILEILVITINLFFQIDLQKLAFLKYEQQKWLCISKKRWARFSLNI